MPECSSGAKIKYIFYYVTNDIVNIIHNRTKKVLDDIISHHREFLFPLLGSQGRGLIMSIHSVFSLSPA